MKNSKTLIISRISTALSIPHCLKIHLKLLGFTIGRKLGGTTLMEKIGSSIKGKGINQTKQIYPILLMMIFFRVRSYMSNKNNLTLKTKEIEIFLRLSFRLKENSETKHGKKFNGKNYLQFFQGLQFLGKKYLLQISGKDYYKIHIFFQLQPRWLKDLTEFLNFLQNKPKNLMLYRFSIKVELK